MVGCGLAPVQGVQGGQPCPATGRSSLSRERAARASRPRRALLLLVAACSGIPGGDYFGFGSSPPPPPPAQPSAVGAGQVKVALILPLSAQGNAGATALSMRNAAEMALAEFNNPDIQLLVKDDGGSPGGAQQAAQQALAEGAEIILGPLFAAVGAAPPGRSRARAACR